MTSEAKAVNTKGAGRNSRTLLALLRAERGWSQKEAARRAHVAEKTYIKVERGQTDKVRVASLANIARTYGIATAQLLPSAARTRRTQEAVATPADRQVPPPQLVNTFHGVVDGVQEDHVAVVFDGEIEGVWLIPLKEVPKTGQRTGAALELQVFRYGRGDYRGKLVVVPPPPLTEAQRRLLAELDRINHRG